MDTETNLLITVYDVTRFKIIARAMDLRGTKFLKNLFMIIKTSVFHRNFKDKSATTIR